MTHSQRDVTKWILILPFTQRLYAFEQGGLLAIYPVSTARKGLGEQAGSECTPRGWHEVASVIGLHTPLNSVFVGRVWTQEIYSPCLADAFPERDWILTRIIRLRGREPGFNQGNQMDSFERYIYIHGTPEPMQIGVPLSHGCIRMKNHDVIHLANWVEKGTRIYIHDRER